MQLNQSLRQHGELFFFFYFRLWEDQNSFTVAKPLVCGCVPSSSYLLRSWEVLFRLNTFKLLSKFLILIYPLWSNVITKTIQISVSANPFFRFSHIKRKYVQINEWINELTKFLIKIPKLKFRDSCENCQCKRFFLIFSPFFSLFFLFILIILQFCVGSCTWNLLFLKLINSFIQNKK